MVGRLVTVLILMLAAGCASQGGSNNFPTRAELNQIAPIPEARSLVLAERRDVPQWVLEGPLPEADAQSVTEQSSAWDQELELAALAHPTRVVRTRAMACAARELGRFFLENAGQPASGLQRHILSLCGSVSAFVNTAYLYSTVADEVPTEQIAGEWHARTGQLVTALLQSGRYDRAGIWFGRAKGQAVIMVVAGESRAEFSALPRVPDSTGRIRIQGRLKAHAESVSGLVNHGRFGVERCDVDENIPLPQFVLSCPVARNDSQAWISVSAFPPGRVLGEGVLDLLVSPSGVRVDRYQRPVRPRSEPITTADQMPRAIIGVLNDVRREANFPTLELAQEQSDTARRLAPTYLLAITGEEPPETADKIALGMMAGWEVSGIVRYGRVSGAFAAQTNDVGDLLATLLENPDGRYALLDPEARAIAIGPVAPSEGEKKLVGALFGTYAFFDENEDHAGDAEAAFKKLTRAARENGVGQVTLSEDLTRVATEAANAVRSGEWPPGRAMNSAISAAASLQPGVQVTGFYVEASDLDLVTFHDELFKTASLQVGLAVTHYKPADSPWGLYVVLVVATGQQPLITASVR